MVYGKKYGPGEWMSIVNASGRLSSLRSSGLGVNPAMTEMLTRMQAELDAEQAFEEYFRTPKYLDIVADVVTGVALKERDASGDAKGDLGEIKQKIEHMQLALIMAHHSGDRLTGDAKGKVREGLRVLRGLSGRAEDFGTGPAALEELIKLLETTLGMRNVARSSGDSLAK